MGQKFSLNKITPDVTVYIQKYFPNYNLIKVLTNGMIYNTVLLTIDKNKNPLILKTFFKNDYDDKDLKFFDQEYKIMDNIRKEIMKKQINNICPIIKMENNSNLKVGLIFRQYVEHNLKERIYLMPYLQNIEKIWITFQILYALKDLKQMKIIHGDLKPENILLTSNLSVYISDLSCYKPAYISIDNYTYYFGTNRRDSMKGCYIAPERLLEKNTTNNINDNEKTYAMDIFSAGVIIAELFLERNIFDFESLLNYKKGNKKLFNIDEILSKIQQKKIRSLIYKMITINPDERIDIIEALKIFSFEICPTSITGFLFHFNSVITSTKFWRPDLIIGHLYRFWTPIWKIIFGLDENPIPLKQNLNYAIVNKIILEEPFSLIGSNTMFTLNKENILCIGDYELIFNPKNGKIYKKYFENNENEDNLDEEKKINNKDCIFIIINYILEAMQYTKYDTTNLIAMEMLNILSKKLDDIMKLQLILPYFVSNLKRKKYIIQLKSLNYIFEILYSINYKDLILPVTEYNYFDSYVFPALLKFYKKENPYIILEFFNNIDKIIDLEEKFLNVTLKSRLKKNKMNLQNIKYNNKDINNIIIEENEERPSIVLSGAINDDDINDARPSIFSYRESEFKINKDKTYEIYKDYDSSLELFKYSLFSVTLDLIGRNNEIDILITVIRKLPSLLLFYGRSKTNDFSKFIINNFNKTDWIIQKEMLYHIPPMTITIGEAPLNDYILPCMEMLISNNSNELKILELIKSIHQLLKMEYLSLKNSINFYEKLLPFLLHPNLSIRNEMINFSESLFNYLSPDEVFCYLYQPLEKYFIIPPIIINRNSIISFCKKFIPRIIYQLELENINYNIEKMFPEKDKRNNEKIGINNLELLLEMINSQKKGNLMAEDDGNVNYCYDNFYYQDFLIQIEEYNKYSLLDPLEKYIKKEISSMAGFNDKGYALETKIFGKIIYLGNNKDKFNFPNFKSNKSLSFEYNNSLISSDLFRIAYILKALGIPMKMVMLEELLKESKEEESESLDKKIKSMAKINYVLNNYYYNKSYNNWRPQGQIITTLYDHKTIPVEKLLPFDNNHFCSFDNMGNAILYNVKINSEDDIILKKKWEYNKKDKEGILYKNNICSLDSSSFALSLGNVIYQYNPNLSPKARDASIKLCNSKDKSNITCIKSFGYSSKEKQNILFCTENGAINLYDNRINEKIALNLVIPKEKGIMNCICELKENYSFLIGTLNGSLLNYDLRLNSIVDDFQYYNETPILGINLFRPSKSNEFEYISLDKNCQYLILWTGAEDHEIGFWNCSDMNCNLLLKLNIQSNGNNELNPLDIEIPYIERNYKNIDCDDEDNNNNNNINLNKKIKKYFKNLNKFTYLYNKNYIKRYFPFQIIDEEYETTNTRINNLNNIYSNPNAVQCILSPFSDYSLTQNYYVYDNSPYLISAGNDKVIRYWDITKDNLNNNCSKKSYIINAPNNINFCQFTKGVFDKTTVLQSNEIYNSKGPKMNMPGLSEFQNINGTLYHSNIQKEFDENDNELKHCTKISDPSHKSIISDLLPLNINGLNGPVNILVSSSWDGTIKIWK